MNPSIPSGRVRTGARFPGLIAVSFLLLVSSVTAAPSGNVAPEAAALLRATRDKLASSPTLSVVARHEGSAEITSSTNDSAPLFVTVSRPNRFHAHQGKGPSERLLGYDGKVLRAIFPGTLLHSVAKVPARDMAGFANAVDRKFGFRPPMAELLADDLVAEMARDGASIRVAGKQRVGWTQCHHLVITQPGQTTELWLSVKDALPKRYKVTMIDKPIMPTKTITFKKWKFGVPAEPALFAPPAPAGSHLVPFYQSR